MFWVRGRIDKDDLRTLGGRSTFFKLVLVWLFNDDAEGLHRMLVASLFGKSPAEIWKLGIQLLRINLWSGLTMRKGAGAVDLRCSLKRFEILVNSPSSSFTYCHRSNVHWRNTCQPDYSLWGFTLWLNFSLKWSHSRWPFNLLN